MWGNNCFHIHAHSYAQNIASVLTFVPASALDTFSSIKSGITTYVRVYSDMHLGVKSSCVLTYNIYIYIYSHMFSDICPDICSGRWFDMCPNVCSAPILIFNEASILPSCSDMSTWHLFWHHVWHHVPTRSPIDLFDLHMFHAFQRSVPCVLNWTEYCSWCHVQHLETLTWRDLINAC